MTRIWPQNALKTNLMMVLVVILVFLREVYSQQQPNLLVNGDFSMLNMNGMRSKYFFSQMTGWNCTVKCQVNDCIRMTQYKISQGLLFNNCTGIVVDLISNDVQNLTQNVVLEYDSYTLSLNYFYPLMNANRKTFEVYFNEEKVFSFRPSGNTDYLPQYLQTQVQAVAGLNTLRLTTKRNVGVDSYGFFVTNIRLTKSKASNSLKSLINSTIVGNFTEILAMIPGSRVIFMDFMTFFVNFDRLQFYYFHNRNYSQYSTFLLTGINILNDLKGLLFRNILQHSNQKVESQIDSFFSSIDHKYDYSPDIVLQRDESGRGFVSNCYPFFVYNIPGTIIVYLFLMGLFWLVRKRPASKLIRKFSLFGILIPMIFEGNIESLTYYSIGEMTLFFSANFHHRFINAFIVFFQLIVTIVAVGSVLFFKSHYKRLIFYFIEDKRNNHLGILCQTVDNGIICMLFGIAHQILFSRPQLQLFVLMSLECAWMLFKICLIFRKGYKKNFSEFIMLNNGFLRMCFIVTFYFYEFAGELRTLINDAYHKSMIIIMILLWLQQLLVSLFELVISIPKFCARLALLQQKCKKIQLGNIIKPSRDASVKMFQQNSKQFSKDDEKNVHRSLYKTRKEYSKFRLPKKGRVFENQKVRIAHLRTKGLSSEDHNK